MDIQKVWNDQLKENILQITEGMELRIIPLSYLAFLEEMMDVDHEQALAIAIHIQKHGEPPVNPDGSNAWTEAYTALINREQDKTASENYLTEGALAGPLAGNFKRATVDQAHRYTCDVAKKRCARNLKADQAEELPTELAEVVLENAEEIDNLRENFLGSLAGGAQV